MRTCLAILAIIIASASVWATGPSSAAALGDPDTAFRNPGGEAPAFSATKSSAASPLTERLEVRLPGTEEGLRLPEPTRVAQAPGTSGPGTEAGTSTEKAAPEGLYSGSIWSRSTMTGDWGGFRNTMAEMGITLDSDFTQIGQGVVSGGLDTGWKYQGRGQITLKVDTQKLGLWPGGFLTVQAEGNYGETVNATTGTLIPVNTSAIFPTADATQFVLPHWYFMQFFSEYVGVVLGKLDTTGGDANAFAHGKGDTQFFNMSFNFNPVTTLIVPYATLGAGVIVLPTKDPKEWIANLSVFNPTGEADDVGFNTLFASGAVIAAETRLTTHFFDLTGHQLVGGGYSTTKYLNLDQRVRNLLIPRLPVSQHDGSWMVYYNFDQYLYQPEKTVDRGLGLFGRFGASDGVANPLKYFYSIGLGGKGLIPSRPLDQFGVGYFYTTISKAQIPSSLGFRDTQGFEVYYNVYVTPWAQLSPDFQIVRPSQQGVETAYVVGFRLRLVF
jgi:porin